MAEKWLQDFFTQQQVKQARKQSLFLVTDWDKEMKLTSIKSRFLLLILSFSQHNMRGIAIDECICQWSVIALVAVYRWKIMEQSDNPENQNVICDYSPHLAISPAIYPPLLENFSHSKPLTSCKKPSLFIKTAGHRAASLSPTQRISSPWY